MMAPTTRSRKRGVGARQSTLARTSSAASSEVSDDSHRGLKRLKRELIAARRRVTIFRAPHLTLYHFSIVVSEWVHRSALYLISHPAVLKTVPIVLLLLCTVALLDNEDRMWMFQTRELASFVLWWVVLGVLSSIGLGTGLHTFVLYTGPHIARFTMAANECGTVDIDSWGPNAYVCPDGADHDPSDVTIFDIVLKVQAACFLWGFGTALGELPPYFVSRAAAASGRRMAELTDGTSIDDEDKEEEESAYMRKAKEKLEKLVQNMGFWGILLAASIPNPLFDLAGITCGHFGISFPTFFTATLVGKAIIKVSIQSIVVIFLFQRGHLEAIVSRLEHFLPSNLSNAIDAMLKENREQFHRAASSTTIATRSVVARLWDLILIGMIMWFLKSIVESAVHERLIALDNVKVHQWKTRRAAALAAAST